ncbi:MAG: sodium ion-translocating decarboxylase subunit beta [Caldilineaceae bacterium]|nr:sodium ion-translocating decarboxylase subunit beta [Caldilineaceae bacterium]
MDWQELVAILTQGMAAFTWANAVMLAAGATLIYLAIARGYEPLLLLPIGAGCIFANLGMSAYVEGSWLATIYDFGIKTELFPLLIFIGVGAMIDFRPLLAQPHLVLMGAAGQVGIYVTLLLAAVLGFQMNEAAAIGVIGAIDGPTAIFVASQLAPELLGPIAVAAYSYMALIPIIQPPLMRLLTSPTERRVRMEYAPRPVSRMAVLIFPMAVTIFISLLAPAAAPLIASLMLGNLLREALVVERLSLAAQHEIANVTTLFLGLAIGATMTADRFLYSPVTGFQYETLMVLALGLFAFVADTVAGLLFGKFMYLISGRKINPLIGACGISAFPMAGRLAAQVAQEEDYGNFLLMHAMGANTAGQLGSVVAGGLLLAVVVGFGIV